MLVDGSWELQCAGDRLDHSGSVSGLLGSSRVHEVEGPLQDSGAE